MLQILNYCLYISYYKCMRVYYIILEILPLIFDPSSATAFIELIWPAYMVKYTLDNCKVNSFAPMICSFPSTTLPKYIISLIWRHNLSWQNISYKLIIMLKHYLIESWISPKKLVYHSCRNGNLYRSTFNSVS